ncbi:MAG: cytosolic protein, partial [Magnetococcales bacterium]|nr:cytosolic protein [Magnetococcales bacterium]
MTHSNEKRASDEFDAPWKDILEAYFPEFLAFFLPIAYEGIDWERGFEFLDKELSRITRDSQVGDRRMDKLVKVWRRDGVELWVLVHIEIQGDRKANFAEGMYVYQYRAYDLYQVPVVGLAILADEDAGWQPTEFCYDLWGTRQSYKFTAVKLLSYHKTELEHSNNPFAIVTLAHLHAKRTKHQTEDRYQEKRRLIRRLYQSGFSRQQVIDLFRFIDWVLHLPEEADRRLWKEIADFEEGQKMPYISSVERFGMQIGEQIGEQRGEQRGE